MADEVSSQAPASEPTTPEPVQEAPTPVEAPVPVPAEPTPSETPTAQIPANEPIAPVLEPLPEPVPQPTPVAQASVPVLASALNLARDLAAKARAVIQSRKQKKLDKIMEVLNTKGKITNDEVEKLLRVSDATATRYLTQLEKEGKLKQEGKTGKSVKYLKL